uniref:m7GpppN-mRNA hydrolase n=1 Tax=Homalodisca liturata TaxID=320908 RepID=A0A1B6I4Q5_9HEMI
MESRDSKSLERSIPVDVLNDLCSRFIINVPEEERKDLVRILFQVELAHWFYLDFYCTEANQTKLKSCGMKEFTIQIFQHIQALQQYVGQIDEVIAMWREYKQAVPTYGAILLDQDLSHVLLVQSYWAKSSWGFPKGKVNQEEEPHRCAAREVLEETGFDISSLINPNDFVESLVQEQLVRLYIISGIPQDTKFEPKTRNEIKAVEWFPIADLPCSKKDLTPKVKMGVSANSFFMVLPFIRRIKKWIFDKQQKGNTHTNRRQRYKSMGDLEVPRYKFSGDIEPGAAASPNNNGAAKGKKHSFSTTLQAEIDDLRQVQVGAKASCESPPRNSRKDRKLNSKTRKLANNTNPDGEKQKPGKNGARKLSPALTGESPSFDFLAPSWINFKFNRQDILDALVY